MTIPIQVILDHRRHFLRFLERRVSSPAVAEDILQSAYLRAIQSSTPPDSPESSIAWFYRILRNAVVDHHRRRLVEDRALETWAAELNQTHEHILPPHDATRQIVCRCIARVLPSLNPAYAEALEQVDLDEGSLAAFAARHAITPANATVRIHRARKALRQRLTKTCGACAIHACLDCNCVA